MPKSLNRAQLIGNLTRDPELRYTPSGRPVCTFAIATNRTWTTESGEKREEVDFHNIVAWGKLAEICSQYLSKGRKAYVEGRMTTRSWTSQDGQQKQRTEIVIDDMLILDSKGSGGAVPGESGQRPAQPKVAKKKPEAEEEQPIGPAEAPVPAGNMDEEVSPDDIPF